MPGTRVRPVGAGAGGVQEVPRLSWDMAPTVPGFTCTEHHTWDHL